MAAEPIIVEQSFDADAATVWKAITDAEQMRQWYFEPMTDFQPEVGFETEFNVHAEGQDFLHQWKITEVIPEQKIAYQWRYKGIPGNSIVTWELSSADSGSQLKLTHQATESFPEDNPMFSREAGIAGWQYLVQQALKTFVDS